MQKSSDLFRKFCPVRFGKIWAVCATLFFLGALASQADEPVAIDKVFVVIHQHPKPSMKDPFLFVHHNIGTHERSCSWFSLRGDYSQFPYRDQFCLRRDAGVVGLKAVFSF